MKRSLALLCAAAAAVGSAQTLQWSNKYTITEPVPSRFTHITKSGATHFFAAGTAGGDAVFAKIDQFGNVLGSVQFDSPVLGAEDPIDIQALTDGSLVALVRTSNRINGQFEYAYCVKYDTNLIKQWEYVLPGTGSVDSLGLAALADGTAVFLSQRRSAASVANLYKLNGAGGLLLSTSVNFTNSTGAFSHMTPNNVTGGFVVVGSTGLRELMITGLTNLSYTSFTGPAPDNSINRLEKVLVDSAGVPYAVGRYNSGSAEAAFYRLNGGALQRANVPNGLNLSNLDASGDNFVYGIGRTDTVGEHQLVKLNKTTFVATNVLTSTGAPYPLFLSVDPSGTRAYYTTGGEFRSRKVADGSNQFTVNLGNSRFIRATAQRGTGGVTGVGEDTTTKQAMIWLADTVYGAPSAFNHIGGQEYTVRGAKTDASGATVALMYDRVTNQRHVIVKYNAAGAAVWARVIPGPGSITDIDVAPDGTVALGGYDNDALVYRYTSAGALSWKRRIRIDGDVIFGNCVAISSTGQIYLGGSGNGIDFVASMSPAGAADWIQIDAPDIATSMVDMKMIGDNKVACISDRFNNSLSEASGAYLELNSNGTFNSQAAISYIDSTLGMSGNLTLGTNATHAFVAVSHNSNNQLDLYRYDPNATPLYSVANAYPNGSVRIAADATNLAVSYYSLVSNSLRLKSTNPVGAANWDVALDATVNLMTDLKLDATSRPHVLGRETSTFAHNSYIARYLTNGVRSSVRRVSGRPVQLGMAPGAAYYVVGENPVRAKGMGPIFTRYN